MSSNVYSALYHEDDDTDQAMKRAVTEIYGVPEDGAEMIVAYINAINSILGDKNLDIGSIVRHVIVSERIQ